MKRLNRTVSRWISSHRSSRPVSNLASAANRYLLAYDNVNFNAATNGELRVLESLPTLGVVIDVGAHLGDWSAAVRRHSTHATVHLFEPNPELCERLAARFRDDDQITIVQCAVSSESGERVLYHDSRRPDMASLELSGRVVEEIPVRVVTGDHYLLDTACEHVDLLKIDAEGHDLEVLRGFTGALRTGRIDVIQFEYSRWNLWSRTLLRDFYELLEPAGYVLGKVRPRTVDFKAYDPADENFRGPAVIAVRGDLQDVISSLAAR